jgi:hypothetical protein
VEKGKSDWNKAVVIAEINGEKILPLWKEQLYGRNIKK